MFSDDKKLLLQFLENLSLGLEFRMPIGRTLLQNTRIWGSKFFKENLFSPFFFLANYGL